jgi:hypothetical protein
MVKGGIGPPLIRVARVVVNQRLPEVLLDDHPGAGVHLRRVVGIHGQGASRDRSGDRGDHWAFVHPAAVRRVEFTAEGENRLGQIGSFVRVVIRGDTNQRVGAVLAHDGNVVVRDGDRRGHGVVALRDGHDSAAGMTHFVDGALQFCRDVPFAGSAY